MALSVMKRHKLVRIPLRRETMATRRLRARLARERQGPDGKWETNRKKTEVRSVKRKCAKLGSAFDAMRNRRLTEEAAAIDGAKDLIIKLRHMIAAGWQDLMAQLESMAVTPKLFRQSPSLFDALLDAAKRCRKSKDTAVALLLAKWRKMNREGKKRTPLLLQDGPCPSGEIPVSTPASTVFHIPAQPRMLTPSRPQKMSRSLKLGSLFATMREKQAAEEAAAMVLAKDLISDLARCTDASMLRSLMSRLQSLSVTAGLLRQSPSIIDALAAAAKRCRKGKDKAVLQLLSDWGEVRKRQQQAPIAQHPTPTKATPRDLDQQVETPSPLKRKLSETPTPPICPPAPLPGPPASSVGAPAKQSKITAFLGAPAKP